MRVSPCPVELWQELCDTDDSCTFYQTPVWHKIVSEYSGSKIHAFLFEVGAEQAILPLLYKTRGPFRFYHSPFGCYSGLLAKEKLKAETVHKIEKYIQSLNYNITPSPFSNNKFSLENGKSNFIQAVELKTIDANNVTETWESDQRRRVRMSVKKGVVISTAISENEVMDYYSVYEKSLNRWGDKATGCYRYSLFQNIWKELNRLDNMKLWIAKVENKIVGGYLVFYHKKHSIAWHGAIDGDYFTFGVSQALIASMIKYSKTNKYLYFDLSMSNNLKNLIAYKSKVGMSKINFETYHHDTPIYSTLKKVASKFFKRQSK